MGSALGRSEASSATSSDLHSTVREFYFHLNCLEGAAKSIKSSTDAQYELVQHFFNKTETLKQPTSESCHGDREGSELTTEDLSEHEKKILAYIQDDICIQAEVLHRTVTSLGELVNRSVSTSDSLSVDKKAVEEFLSIRSKSVLLPENINQKRFDLNYLKANCEEQRSRLRETEKHIEELSRDIPGQRNRGRDVGSARKSRSELSVKISDDPRQTDKNSKQSDHLTTGEDKLSQKDIEISKLQTDITDLKRKVESLSTENKDLKKERINLKGRISSMDKDIKELWMKKDQYGAEPAKIGGFFQHVIKHQKASVMLYVARRGDLLNTVMRELTSMLKTQFQTQDTDLDVIECDSAPQIVPNMPVLVVCIHTSRLGTDVSNALTGVTGSPQVAVVILHHKDIHALPNQSSDRILTSQEYKCLGAIIDMAFLSSKGLYTCDMNNNAVSALVSFIKQRNMP